jgi:processing peptidase subunit beta
MSKETNTTPISQAKLWHTSLSQSIRSLASAAPISTKYVDPVTNISTLSNGLTVASESQPHAQTATVGVWVDAGSRVDGKKASGSAHFLEVSC